MSPARLAMSPQPAKGHLGCSVAGTRSSLHLLGPVGGMLQDHQAALVALGYPRAPEQVQCTHSLQAFLPENCPFSHFLGAELCDETPPQLPSALQGGLGAVAPAGSGAWGWKGLRQAKENKSAAGPGWLTSQTTVFDSLLLPCQVQLLPHSHPLAAGARGDVGFLRSGGEGGCRGKGWLCTAFSQLFSLQFPSLARGRG